MKNKTRLEFSGVELMEPQFDYMVRDMPDNFIVRVIEKANQLGLEGKTVKTVEVQENFATGRKYLDFVCISPSPASQV